MTAKFESAGENFQAVASPINTDWKRSRETCPVSSGEQTKQMERAGVLPAIEISGAPEQPRQTQERTTDARNPKPEEDDSKYPREVIPHGSWTSKDPDATRLAQELKADHGDDVFLGRGKLDAAADKAANRLMENGDLDKQTFEQLIKAMVNDGEFSDKLINKFVDTINSDLKAKGSDLSLNFNHSRMTMHQPNAYRDEYSVSVTDKSKQDGKTNSESHRLCDVSKSLIFPPVDQSGKVGVAVMGYSPTYFTYDGKPIPY